MRFIDIDLDGTVVRARLNDDLAANTCEAIWSALPFGGQAVHAQVSGEMFRMLDPVPIDDLDFESAEYFQHPGSVVYYPPIKELAFCVGEARFGATHGLLKLTPVAEIEGDFSEWGTKGDRIQFTGQMPIEFRRAEDQESQFRYPELKGRKVALTFDDVGATATLLEDVSPAAARAFASSLPLSGIATNSTWGFSFTRFWANGDEADGRVPLDAGKDHGSVFHWPGYIYYDAADQAVKLCYGDGQEGVQGVPSKLIPVARIDGDLSAIQAKGKCQLEAGKKPMSFKLVS
jgi:hypothetical protein